MAETVTGISYYNNFPEIMIYKYQVQMVLILMRDAHIISIKPLLKLFIWILTSSSQDMEITQFYIKNGQSLLNNAVVNI